MPSAQTKPYKWSGPAFLDARKRPKSAMAEDEPFDTNNWDDAPLPKDMIFVTTWLLRGPDMRDLKAGDLPRFHIRDHEYCGYGNLFGIKHEESVTLFCPYYFKSWRVPKSCAEIAYARHAEFRMGPMISLLNRKWVEYGTMGTVVEYDTAAVILRKLGAKIPTKIEISEERRAELTRMRGGVEKKEGPSGGKPMEMKIKKPVKRDSKRGKVLEFFLKEGHDTPRSLREAMATFDTTRSNILSTLFILNKDHGFGYVLQDDAARVRVPQGEIWS